MIRENNIKNRAISVFLVISMLVTNLLNIAMAYAETNVYEDNIGCTAIFNTDDCVYFPVTNDPTNPDSDQLGITSEDFGEDFKVIITEYYIHDIEDELPTLWYKVEAAPGCDSPEVLIQHPWVLQNYLGEYADPYDSLIIIKEIEEDNITVVDEDGNEVGEEIDLPQYEKKKLIGVCSLSGDVDYQWQILIEDTWIDIYGQDKAEFTLTYGVVASVLNDFQTKIRLITKQSSNVIRGDAVTVTVIPYEEDELIEDEVQREEITTDYEVYNDGEEVVKLKNNNDNIDDDNDSIENSANVKHSMMKLSTFSNVDDVNGVMLADENGNSGIEFETHTVIINYVFQDGEIAAPSWSGQFPKGSEVKETIQNPTVKGFAPEKDSCTIDIPSIAKDETYTVTYYPAEVEFKVYHYKQNAENDYYILDETETMQGYTGSTVGENLKKEYKGFYAYNYDTTLEIAADGSTEVEIYYDRYYYLMSFDLGGGYGVEPIYARYGTPISVGTPNRPGYSFTGWDSEIPATIPSENTRFTAQWTVGDTSFDVVFWYENANDEGYSQGGVLENVPAESGSIINGADYKDKTFPDRDDEHFTYSHADENVTVQGDGSTVVNVYFSRNVYKLTFVMSGWTGACSVETHQHGNDCYTLTCPQEEHNHATAGCEPSGETDCGLSEHSHSSSCCTTEEHTHTNSCYTLWWVTCGKSEHSHGDNCQCSQVSHTHSDACYTYECGKIAHIHSQVGGSCYNMTCGKEEHYHSGNTCYLIVTRKYDSDITDIWNENPVKGVIDGGNAFKSSVTSDYYSFLEKMPGQNITLTASDDSGNKYTWYYYLEILPSQDTTGLTIREDYGKMYYEYNSASRYANSLNLTYKEDYYPITGFTQRDDKVPTFNNRTAYLYYTRNSYDLTFSNNGNTVTDKGGTFLFEADISDTYFVPEYPANLEPNAYEFDGWYTSPYYGDTQFNFKTTDEDGNTIKATMPANDLTLYAKWTPKTHTVKIFKTNDLNEQIGDTQTVPHGSLAEKPRTPTNGSYSFVGWFYEGSDGKERAFDFSMPVNQDLVLYGKWSSNVLVNYTIKYAIEEGEKLIYIAPSTTGQALAGTTKTFLAKAGDELDVDYREGYFPTTSSHSITLNAEDNSANTFTFVYVPIEEVNYIVRYIDKATNQSLLSDKNVATTKAIVTETFEVISGYMPDAYQKTLVLSANGENIITFWYIEDTEHAPVQVIHYIQNIEGEGYTVYQNTSNLNTAINDEFSASILSIDGFTFARAAANDKDVTPETGSLTVSGTVTAEGLVLELYYNRNLYPYEFRFVEEGTEKVLAEPVTDTARYGAQVVQNAKQINGYTPSSNSGAITIKIEKEDKAERNVYIFYYKRALADLTIIKSGFEDIDENQSFIFKVTGIDTNISITVVIHGNDSVTIKDLPVGKYQVKEISDWSWRYSPKDPIKEVPVDANGTTIPFENERTKIFWLDGNAYCDNRFGKGNASSKADTSGEEEVETNE